ncbi:MAG: S8 family serine peptidase [Patescibacteria group bacterium]|jgi:serine protease
MKNKIKFLLISVLVMSCVLLVSNFVLAADEYVPDQIIVKLKQNVATTADAVGKIAQGFNTTILRTDESANFAVLKLPTTATVDQAVAYYNNKKLRPEVEYAEPNYIYHMSWSPNDPYRVNQWNFNAINMAEAWDYDTTAPLHGGDPSVVVAVVDTGIAYEDFDIYSKASDFTGIYPTFASGYDFVNNDTHANDDQGHGTHVASTIAESTDNSIYTAGIAFNSTIMPVKVLDSNGSGDAAKTASGITWAKDHGATIINMSLGSTAYSQTVADAVTAAANAGVIMVAAAGNGGQDGVGDPELDYPARLSQVISVGSTRYHNNLRSSFSNYGNGLDLVAPGGQTDEGYFMGTYSFNATYGAPCTYDPTGTFGDPGCFIGSDGILQQSFAYFFLPVNYAGNATTVAWLINGTSQATPHVAGTAALLKAYGVPNNNLRSIIDNSATDLGTSGYDTEYGHGLLNAANAFTFPTITSLSTSSADNSSNTNITVSGSNFVAGATMAIGATALTNVNVVNSSTITAIVPKHLSSGSYDISVTSNGKTTSASNSFTVLNSAPSDVSNLRVRASNGRVYFKWKNPTTWDFDKVKIRRKNKSFPTSYSDGKKVFNKSKTSFTNKNLNRNKKYYYKIYTYDTAGNYSSGVPVVVVPKNNSIVSESSNNYVATGDVNKDGLDEMIVGAKKGHESKIYVTNKNGDKLYKKNGFYPFGSGKSNCGINVASGDLNMDGTDEIIASQGAPCKSRVKVFNKSGKSKFKKKGFKPFKKGVGVTVASGDLDGDNYDEIIVGQEKDQAKIYMYKLSGNSFVKVFKSKGFKAYSGNNGVRVFSGDLDFDGKDEIVTMPNSAKKEIKVFTKTGKKKFKSSGFLPYGNYTNYVRTFVGDSNTDGYYEINTSSSGSSLIKAFSYKGQKSTPKVINNYTLNSKEFAVGRF